MYTRELMPYHRTEGIAGSAVRSDAKDHNITVRQVFFFQKRGQGFCKMTKGERIAGIKIMSQSISPFHTTECSVDSAGTKKYEPSTKETMRQNVQDKKEI